MESRKEVHPSDPGKKYPLEIGEKEKEAPADLFSWYLSVLT